MKEMRDDLKKVLMGGASIVFALSWFGFAGGCFYQTHRADVAEKKLAEIATALEDARKAFEQVQPEKAEKPKPATRWISDRALASSYMHEMRKVIELHGTEMQGVYVDKQLEEEQLCFIPQGTRVLMLEDDGNLARVMLPDGRELFTFSSLLDEKEVKLVKPKKFVKFKRERVAFRTRKAMAEHRGDAWEDVPEYVAHWVIPAEQKVWVENKTEEWYRVSDEEGNLWYVPL